MNTRSIAMSSIGVPGFSAMYSSARSATCGRLVCSVCRIRHAPVTGATMPGLVPQVTYGASSLRRSRRSRSNFAPGSVGNLLPVTQRHRPSLRLAAQSGGP